MNQITKKMQMLSAAILITGIACMAQDKSLGTVPTKKTTTQNLFIDEHDLEPGKVKFEDVLAAHQKDLAVQSQFGVNFIKFWVDEKGGKVYCLSTAKNAKAIVETHRKAHGLVPAYIYKMKSGVEASAIDGEQYFLDVHQMGAGKVTAAAVEGAHKKDLAVQKKYGVNFINYWVDEKNGNVFCLSQGPNANAVIATHKEAHGLLPAFVLPVKEGK